jgi:hypothetical protein
VCVFHLAFALSLLQLVRYTGQSVLQNMLDGPGSRKRTNIVHVMDSFPGGKFILFGDSGEQDLELYVGIAMKRPEQVIAIFIRDITLQGSSEMPDYSFPDSSLASGPGIRSGPVWKQAAGVNWNALDVGIIARDWIKWPDKEWRSAKRRWNRSTVWRSRITAAKENVPADTQLVFFKEPWEITKQVLELVTLHR